MRVFVHRHQNKADGLVKAIQQHGGIVTSEMPLDLMLLDYDGPEYYLSLYRTAEAHDLPVILYTHGALACVAWDGLYKAHPLTRAYLAISEAEKAIMQAYEYPCPVEVIGWYWSKQQPQRAMQGDRLLFAPIHPLGNGFLPEVIQEANARAFRRLLSTKMDVTVYYLGTLESQGLWIADGVKYIHSAGTNRTDLFCQYDCVVSCGTFAHLAIASGMPTYMYAQDVPPWEGHTAAELRYAKRFDEYKHLMDYPYDLDHDATLFSWQRDSQLQDWYKRHIGNPMDSGHLMKVLDNYVR